MIKTDFLCGTCGRNLVQIGPTEFECPECDWREPTEEESAAIARAEAAEAELASALAVIDHYQSRMFAAEKRVAELEAAQAWQPVTEEMPSQEHMYLVWDGTEIFMVTYKSTWDDATLTWRDEYDDPLFEKITHWRPLPPPPTGDEPY